MREHHWVWISHGNAPVPRGYVLHHKDEDKTNNDYSNLQLLSRGEHAKLHGKGRKVSDSTREKMKAVAARRVADPEHRKHLSERAKAQHAAGKLGAATVSTEGRRRAAEANRIHGRKQADRLRNMIAATPSEEMSRRSYQRKIFQR